MRIEITQEQAEDLRTLYSLIYTHDKRKELLDAQAKIEEGKRDMARARFWNKVERLFPETRYHSGWRYDYERNELIKMDGGDHGIEHAT